MDFDGTRTFERTTLFDQLKDEPLPEAVDSDLVAIIDECQRVAIRLGRPLKEVCDRAAGMLSEAKLQFYLRRPSAFPRKVRPSDRWLVLWRTVPYVRNLRVTPIEWIDTYLRRTIDPGKLLTWELFHSICITRVDAEHLFGCDGSGGSEPASGSCSPQSDVPAEAKPDVVPSHIKFSRWTEADRRQLFEFRQRGLSWKEIAKLYGCERQVVRAQFELCR